MRKCETEEGHFAQIMSRKVRFSPRVMALRLIQTLQRHKVGLKASDGRLYAIFSERLPFTVARLSTVNAQDAHVIIRDIPSA